MSVEFCMVLEPFSIETIHKRLMSEAQIRFWYHHFKFGWKSFENDSHSTSRTLKCDNERKLMIDNIKNGRFRDNTDCQESIQLF